MPRFRIDEDCLMVNANFFLNQVLMKYLLFAFQKAMNQWEKCPNFPVIMSGMICRDGRNILLLKSALCYNLVQKFVSSHASGRKKHKLFQGIFFRLNFFNLSMCCQEKEIFLKQFHLDRLLIGFRNEVISHIKQLYDKNKLGIEMLLMVLNVALTDFCDREGIQLIDIFTILNSFRRDGIAFFYDVKLFRIHFSDHDSLMFGKNCVTITLDSSFILDKLGLIVENLESNIWQQDLLLLMHLTLLRDDMFSSRKILINDADFELTCQKNYDFWFMKLIWNKTRMSYLKEFAKNIFKQDLNLYSKKDASYYHGKTTLVSIKRLFSESYVQDRPAFKGRIFSRGPRPTLLLTFDPTS
jgi:hypothetical protein